MDSIFIAGYEGNYGVGRTPLEAFYDLKQLSSPEFEDIIFYKAEEIKVELEFKIVNE